MLFVMKNKKGEYVEVEVVAIKTVAKTKAVGLYRDATDKTAQEELVVVNILELKCVN